MPGIPPKKRRFLQFAVSGGQFRGIVAVFAKFLWSVAAMSVPAEFAVQMTKCQRRLHAFILSLVWNPADADDVLQETNLVLWQKVAEFDDSRPFLPWAMRFAQFQAMAWLKSRQRNRFVFDHDLVQLLASEAAAEPLFDPRRIALASCLEKLRQPQRDLVLKRYEPNGSVNAMAAAVGITPKAVSDRLRRIRQGLLECVNAAIAREALT
jgi:RNA polymerase sigma-70 factor (ECF subfamily)